jgi:hypothetical protein
MTRLAAILFLFSTAALRADLTLEQQSIDATRTNLVTIQLHGTKMRVDQPGLNLSIIVDLKTRDSFTLLTKLKQFLQRFGSEVRWQMDEEKKFTGGTNDMDAPPTPAMATGKSATLNGYDTKIYTWSGARGQTETLWVAGQYPDYKAIRAELYKLDQFNDSGPHRNAQPILSVLPGMVVKTEGDVRGHTMTTTLLSVSLKPLDESLFELPIEYTPWKHPDKENNETNSPPIR